MFDFLKKLFKTYPKRSIGALESPVDPRNISSSVLPPVSIPAIYDISDVGHVLDQGQKSKCTGSSVKLSVDRIYNKAGVNADVSDDDIYEQCKLIDGIPNVLGTYPTVTAKVVTSIGACSTAAYLSGNEALKQSERSKFKLKGYAFVDNNFYSIAQAISSDHIVHASLNVDNNWFIGKIMKVLQSVGRHYIAFTGQTLSNEVLRGQNSWGKGWIGYIAGIFNPFIKPGCFEIRYLDIKDSVLDMIIFADIPDIIIENAKKTEYKFTKNLSLGDSGYDVIKLQERLKKEGFPLSVIDGKYGLKTQGSVMAYQKANGITSDGTVGSLTRAKLNEKTSSFIPLFAKAIQDHEGYLTPKQYPPLGSRSYRNNSPANFKLSTHSLTAYMAKLGATNIDKDNFVIFPTYDIGFTALQKFLIDACSGKLLSYQGNMTLLEFFRKYAPSFDSNDPDLYAKTVAKKLGVSINIAIKELL